MSKTRAAKASKAASEQGAPRDPKIGPDTRGPPGVEGTGGPDCGPAGPHDRLMTLKEVLERVRHKKSWLYEEIRQKRFPPGFKMGGRFWYESQVEKGIRDLIAFYNALPPPKPSP